MRKVHRTPLDRRRVVLGNADVRITVRGAYRSAATKKDQSVEQLCAPRMTMVRASILLRMNALTASELSFVDKLNGTSELDKPWKESRGPIIAAEQDVRKAEVVNGHLVHPINLLPAKVGDPILPVVIGIWADVRALMKPEGSATALRRALGAYLHSKRYYFASAQPDSMRHDIDGRPVVEVSAQDRLAAQRSFMDLKQKDVVKGESPAAPPSPPAVQLSKAEMIRASLLKRK